jgi:hypothetical protein
MLSHGVELISDGDGPERPALVVRCSLYGSRLGLVDSRCVDTICRTDGEDGYAVVDEAQWPGWRYSFRLGALRPGNEEARARRRELRLADESYDPDYYVAQAGVVAAGVDRAGELTIRSWLDGERKVSKGGLWEMAGTSRGYQQVDARLWAGFAFNLVVGRQVDGFEELIAARRTEKQQEAYAQMQGLSLEEYQVSALKIKVDREWARAAGQMFRATGAWPVGYEGRKRTCYKLPAPPDKTPPPRQDGKPRREKGEFVPWRKKGSGKPKGE